MGLPLPKILAQLADRETRGGYHWTCSSATLYHSTQSYLLYRCTQSDLYWHMQSDFRYTVCVQTSTTVHGQTSTTVHGQTSTYYRSLLYQCGQTSRSTTLRDETSTTLCSQASTICDSHHCSTRCDYYPTPFPCSYTVVCARKWNNI